MVITTGCRNLKPKALELDGQLASVDGHFPAYPELAGRLLA